MRDREADCSSSLIEKVLIQGAGRVGGEEGVRGDGLIRRYNFLDI